MSICTQLPTQSNICRTNNSQQCWSCCVHLHTTANTIQHLQNQQLPTMLELLCPFAHNCQHNPTSAESTTPNNVGVVVSICTQLPTQSNICRINNSQQCWELLCAFAHDCQHHPTSAKSRSPTMLGVVAYVCTGFKVIP